MDTGDDLVDSFAGIHCSPKFRVKFPVHRLFENYTKLRSDYETSQEYRNWKASGQNDGLNFMEFQKREPLHVMLHTFLHNLDLSGFTLSSLDDVYSFDSSETGEHRREDLHKFRQDLSKLCV